MCDNVSVGPAYIKDRSGMILWTVKKGVNTVLNGPVQIVYNFDFGSVY